MHQRAKCQYYYIKKIIVGDLVRLYTDAIVHCESKKDEQSLIQVAEHIAWGY